MNSHKALTFWFIRTAAPVTLIAAPVAVFYVLLRPEPLDWPGSPWAAFILVHCLALTWILGRFRSTEFSFIYTRGFSRNRLWAGLIAGTGISAAMVWLPAALVVWLSVRSHLQDVILQNPYFPLMAPTEWWVPLEWLALYALALPVFHYARVRLAMPARDRWAGPVIAAVVTFGAVDALCRGVYSPLRPGPGVLTCILLVFWLAVSLGTLPAARLVHAGIEVQGAGRGRRGALAPAAVHWTEVIILGLAAAAMALAIPLRAHLGVREEAFGLLRTVSSIEWLVSRLAPLAALLLLRPVRTHWMALGCFAGLYLLFFACRIPPVSPPALLPQRPDLVTMRLPVTYGVGAHLWVNGVDLGELPVSMTRTEFESWAPRRDGPPVGLYEALTRLLSASGGMDPTPQYRWAEGYCLGVRLGDEWGRSLRLVGYSDAGDWPGKEDNPSASRFTLELAAAFPQHERVLRDLLDQARRSGYHPDSDWFDVLDRQGVNGWIALWKCGEVDARMLPLRDALARRLYGLDRVQTPQDAWRVLNEIAGEAEKRGGYCTASPAGRGIEMLAPKLDVEQVLQEARRLLPLVRGVPPYTAFTFSGQPQFVCGRLGQQVILHGSYPLMSGSAPEATTDSLGYATYYREHPLPMRAYIVAHAVWSLARLPDTGPQSPRRRIQEELVPDILRTHFSDEQALQAAVWLGGPVIEQYLIRQYDYCVRTGNVCGADSGLFDGWDTAPRGRLLLLLARLPGPAGSDFRLNHADDFMAHAGDPGLLEAIRSSVNLDRQLGKQCLAYRAWTCIRPDGLDPDSHFPWTLLRDRWSYLASLEPIPDAADYAAAFWYHGGDQSDISPALGPIAALPANRRDQVLHALFEAPYPAPGGVEQSERLGDELKQPLPIPDDERNSGATTMPPFPPEPERDFHGTLGQAVEACRAGDVNRWQGPLPASEGQDPVIGAGGGR